MALAMKFILAISMLCVASAKPSFPSIHQLTQASERRLDAAPSTDEVCVDMTIVESWDVIEAWPWCGYYTDGSGNGDTHNCCCWTCEEAAATFCPNGFPINPDTGENITFDGEIVGDIINGSWNCGSGYWGDVGHITGGTTSATFWEACCTCVDQPTNQPTNQPTPSICSEDRTSCTTECAAYSDCYLANYAACSSTICTCPNDDEGDPSDACYETTINPSIEETTLGWANWRIREKFDDDDFDTLTSCDDRLPHESYTIYFDTCSAITDSACALCTECASEMEDYLVCAHEEVFLESFGLTCDLSDSCNHVTTISMANKAAKAFSVLMGVLVFGTALAGLA